VPTRFVGVHLAAGVGQRWQRRTGPSVITPLTFEGFNLVLSWPANSPGWVLQSNSAGLGMPGMWFVVPESATSNRMVIPANQSQSNVLFWLMHP